MINKFGIIPISFLMILHFSCSKGSKKPDDSTTHIETKSSPDTTKKVLNSEVTSPTSVEKNVSIFELLQGKWQHTDDRTNYLVFEGNHRKEIAEGMDKWEDEAFVLSDKCANQLDKDNGIEPEKDKYISCAESDLCWYIINIDKENLSLSYMGRGNTLTYKRVK